MNKAVIMLGGLGVVTVGAMCNNEILVATGMIGIGCCILVGMIEDQKYGEEEK